LKIETQTHDDRTLTLTIEVEEERVQPALRSAARRLSKNYRIPGFRPGKAPYETVLRFVGEGAIYNEALEDIGSKVYEEALDQEKIDAFAAGELTDLKLKPMVLTFKVPLRPIVELGDYRALRVPFLPAPVTDEAVQEQMEHLREHHAVLEPMDRAAALGDVVTLDVSGFLNEGLNPSDFLLGDKDVALLLEEKADWPIPGFGPQIVGMTAGEAKKFDLAFADDYPNEGLRGQLAHFEVACKEVKNRQLPDWNDDLAKEVGDYADLNDLRAKLRAELQQRSDNEAQKLYADQALNQLVDQAQVVYPPSILEAELNEYLDDLNRRLQEQNLTLEDFLKIEGKTQEAFRVEVTPQAERRLKRTLVLGKIVDLEKLEVTDTEINAQIDRISSPWGDRSSEIRKAFSTDRAHQMLSLDLLSDKAVQRLAAIARGEAPTETALLPDAAPVAEAA
jgi:trigger factor